MRKFLTSLTFLAALVPHSLSAQQAKPPVIDRIQVFQIFDDDGKLSKDLANAADDTIIANGPTGSGIQVLIKVVLKGKPNQVYDSGPTVHIKATPSVMFEGGPKVVEGEFVLSYVGVTGEVYRSVLLDHGCNDFKIEAYVTDGGKRTSEFSKSYFVLCGD